MVHDTAWCEDPFDPSVIRCCSIFKFEAFRYKRSHRSFVVTNCFSFSFLVGNSRQNHRISPMEDLKSEFKTGRSGLGGERFHRSVEQIDEVLFFCFILQCGSGCSLITK